LSVPLKRDAGFISVLINIMIRLNYFNRVKPASITTPQSMVMDYQIYILMVIHAIIPLFKNLKNSFDKTNLA